MNDIKRRAVIKSLVSGGLGSFLAINSGVLNAFSSTGVGKSNWGQYDSSIVIDGLSGAFSLKEPVTQALLDIFKSSGISALNMTVPYPGDDYVETLKKVRKTQAIIEQNSGHMSLIQSASDILEAKRENKLGIIMGFQSTEMLDESLSGIAEFAKMGVRIMQVSYNGPSILGSGGLVKKDAGITSLGKQAIEMMEAEKVLVDLSHSGKRTVASAIEYAKRPIVISHTGCNAIYEHPRNNDDTELKAAADTGGLVGLYLMPFLEGGEHEIKADMVIKHVLHAYNVCGEDHVAIGSDQGVVPVNDGPEYRENIRKEVERRIAAGISAPGETPHRPPFIPELNSERRMELIAYRLSQKGLSDRVIEKIIGKNWLRVFAAVWN
ncbi:dipeptidase [Microbulbifer sp. GL-2]|uniref:dipeptidase n=1 Tax=Microbulbifer sp. GL-2 TaxID=2591606 RepID=UPI001164C37E|nr:membrane dipeptidase [Microbulbifer sp. GL-2]BBM03271.1 peptidase M19 [Microbulbifer sp. GL-2]